MLTFEYKKSSTLPRREFLMVARVWYIDGTDQYLYYPVTAPDAIMAYRVLTKHLDRLVPCNKYMVESVREVIRVWAGGIRVPSVRVMLDPERGWLKYS